MELHSSSSSLVVVVRCKISIFIAVIEEDLLDTRGLLYGGTYINTHIMTMGIHYIYVLTFFFTSTSGRVPLISPSVVAQPPTTDREDANTNLKLAHPAICITSASANRLELD